MAALKSYREHNQFGKSLDIVEVEYDFAVDGGATGALDIIKMTVAMVLVDCMTKIDTTFTSGGSATLIWGVKGGDTDACLDVTSGAVANLVAGAVIPGEAAGKQIALAADSILEMTIGTAAMTAGKCRFVMMLNRFN